MVRAETCILEKSPGCLNCISFLTGPGINTKENQQTVSPPFWFICLLFHSIGELIHLSWFSLTRAVASWLLYSTPAFEPSPGTSLLCACPRHSTLTKPLSILTHRAGSWLKAFLWLSIVHRLNDTISIDWYRSIDCFFPSIGHSGICSCEFLLFLLSACKEVALHMYSKWRHFELHPRSINTRAWGMDSSFASPVGKEIADISAKQRLTVDRYLTDSRLIN